MALRFNIPAACLLLAAAAPALPQEACDAAPVGMGLVELLEFIGEFSTDDGRLVSPEELLAEDAAATGDAGADTAITERADPDGVRADGGRL